MPVLLAEQVGEQSSLFQSLVAPALFALGGSFAGAYFAFWFARLREKAQLDARRVEAGNEALFELIRQFNTLVAIERQFVAPFRGDSAIALAMPPYISAESQEASASAGSLAYLLQSSRPNLLLEVMVAQDKYATALRAFDHRSDLHASHVQPAMEGAGFELGRSYSVSEIGEMLGQGLFERIQSATQGAVECLDDGVSSLKSAIKDLREALRGTYPGVMFIDVGLPEDDRAR